MAADPTYAEKVHYDGPDKITVESGGTIDFLAGAVVAFAGVDQRAALATAPAAVAAGYKIARGVHTQVAATDTIVTGLTTVIAVVAQFQSAPTVKQLLVAASVGDQAGTPAAGSILIKTFKPTAVNDVTPTPATDFTENLAIGWIAIGT